VRDRERHVRDLQQVPRREELHEGWEIEEVRRERPAVDQQVGQAGPRRLGADGDPGRAGADHQEVDLVAQERLPGDSACR